MPNTGHADLAPGEAEGTLHGLTSIEAARRIRLHGPNDLVPESKPPLALLLGHKARVGPDGIAAVCNNGCDPANSYWAVSSH